MGSIFTVDLSNVWSLLLKFTGAGCVRGTISYIYYEKEKDITETMKEVTENCNSDTTTSPPEPESQKEKRDRLLYNRANIKEINENIKTAKENADKADGGDEEDSNCEKFKELIKKGVYAETQN